MCHVLGVSRSGYYSWFKRPKSEKKKSDEAMVIEIKRVYHQSYETYGARRIKARLEKEGIKCGKNRVSRLMRENGICSRLKRKYKATTNSNHRYPVAPNLLNQDFTADRPNEKWVGDLTYIWTDEGWIYLAAVEDLFHKEVIGWAFGSRITKEVTIEAIKMAIGKESPSEGLIFHSDRGSQYAAYAYQDILRENNINQSMSRKGNCYDNAVIESFFSSLKKDRIYGKKFRTREDAKSSVIEYIELFYNSRRLHSSLGYNSPREFKEKYYKELLAHKAA